ncbi:MAG: lipase family alpha/beta hydrolase [Culicoidibacterales bacterium]
MKQWYNRFVQRSIFYHPHLLVKPKQFITRSVRFWDNVQIKKTESYLIKSVQGYYIDVDLYKSKSQNQDLILLVHGHFTDKTEFNPIIPLLCAKGYDVAVYNVYGKWTPFSFPMYTYGKKEREDLRNIILKFYHYPRIHLVGHSLGAAIIAEYTDTFTDAHVCTKTMIALYETLNQAIDAGMQYAPVPFFTFKVDASKQMAHFSQHRHVNLYEQDMKCVLSGKDSSHLLIFGSNDVRAPYFKTALPTFILKNGTHTNYFTSKRKQIADTIHRHIQANIPK